MLFIKRCSVFSVYKVLFHMLLPTSIHSVNNKAVSCIYNNKVLMRCNGTLTLSFFSLPNFIFYFILEYS